MKPMLDNMTDLVVKSLDGEARSFYDREFDFFNEVTSISGKLKPFIKKTKPEKKVSKSTHLQAYLLTHLLIRPRLTRRWRRLWSMSGSIYLVTPTVL